MDGQPFPKTGVLFKNSDLSLERLKQKLEIKSQSESEADVYAYILSTVSSGNNESGFVQNGSAPNFQGDHITLCTCKRYMRSSRSVDCWRNIWVAGFTSNAQGHNYLFYLIQVERAFNSFRELWNANILSKTTKRTKNASRNSLGDLFRPLNKANDFSVHSYAEPMEGHSHRSKKNPAEWHEDICYRTKSGKRAPLLVGNPGFSFVWTQPLIYCSNKLSRGHRRPPGGLQGFLGVLRTAPK